MKKPHIYILYTNTGAGHRTPALAIADKIEELFPNQYKIIASNFFDDVGEKKFNTYIEKSWDYLLKHPILTKIIVILGRILKTITPHYIQIVHPKVWKKSINHIYKIKPDLVLNTHFFTHTIALDARKFYQMNFPIIGFNPDTFETFPQWDNRGDMLLVCSEMAKESALSLKHEENKLSLVFQALRKEFEQPRSFNSKALKREYKIPIHHYTILMSDGGQGVGNMLPTILQLVKMKKNIAVIAVCGKNKSLYKKLILLKRTLQARRHPLKLKVFSFVNSMTPLIAVSDIFIGKSGPATIMECLKMKLPVIVNFFASSAEKRTAQFFSDQKMAVICPKVSRINKLVSDFMYDPKKSKEIKKRINQTNFFDNGSERIARIIADTVDYHIEHPYHEVKIFL